LPDPRHERGIIDTSVVIDLERIDPGSLPSGLAISANWLFEQAENSGTRRSRSIYAFLRSMLVGPPRSAQSASGVCRLKQRESNAGSRH
jgi:hypothetical protein